MTETSDMRRRLYERVRQYASAGGMALPEHAGAPPPEDPELRAKWEARALEEVQANRDPLSAAMDRAVARGREHARQMADASEASTRAARAAKAQPAAPARRAGVRQAAEFSPEDLAAMKLFGISEETYRQYSNGGSR